MAPRPAPETFSFGPFCLIFNLKAYLYQILVYYYFLIIYLTKQLLYLFHTFTLQNAYTEVESMNLTIENIMKL